MKGMETDFMVSHFAIPIYAVYYLRRRNFELVQQAFALTAQIPWGINIAIIEKCININVEKYGLVTNCDRFENLKHFSVNPCALIEQGVSMLSAVLRSKENMEKVNLV